MVFTCDLLLNEKMTINPVKNKSKQIKTNLLTPFVPAHFSC